MRLLLCAMLIAVGVAASNAGVEAAPSNDPLLKYFSGSWTCKTIDSRHPKKSGARFSYTGALHGKSLVWTYNDGSSGSEVYDPGLKKYLWLGASGDDGSYDASMSPGWIGNKSTWQIVLASWPRPLGAFLVTRISDTRYTEGYQLHGVTKGEWICAKV